ncbi:hypothetical protein B7463_g9133, partial [Scytalidium lignicola]
MMQKAGEKAGNLSYHLGGKAEKDKNWSPDIAMVNTTIEYAIATKRLNHEPTTGGDSAQTQSQPQPALQPR